MPEAQAVSFPLILTPGSVLDIPFPEGRTLQVRSQKTAYFPDWTSLILAAFEAGSQGPESPLRFSWREGDQPPRKAGAIAPGGVLSQSTPSQRPLHSFLTHPTYTGPGCAICGRSLEEHPRKPPIRPLR